MTAVRNKTSPSDIRKMETEICDCEQGAIRKIFCQSFVRCENQTAEKRPAEKFLGIDFAMQGMCVFSTGERAGYPMFYRNAEKKLAREQRKLSRCEKGSRNYQKQKKRVALYHEKIKNQRKDFQHKLSHSLQKTMTQYVWKI